MSVDLVAFDLDGTLVGRDSQISARVRACVAAMLAQGTASCIVTGRMFRAAAPFVRELGLRAPTICYQGAWIVDTESERRLFDRPIAPELVREILDEFTAEGPHLQLYADDRYYCERNNRFAALYASLAGIAPIVGPIRERFANRSATKAVIVSDPDIAAQVELRARRRFGDRLYITRSYPEFVEMLDPTVDKGSALQFVAQGLGIPMERVLAIGDSWNDLPIIERAGIGVAMGNAPVEVRERADAVVGAVDEDGVCDALERFVLR
ncbi:MAG: HAD family phosphatase [Candidatus Eremiobacteraeota bacterium]|uniref:Cof-like hydrolase n=1 Tax=mine drainage metagenome TaxID=410659 RepID=E6PDQ8_9ZZZZ|nr:HAD family phosphatase [Candidatus Eremiobacteraeota bacterium]